MIQPPLEVFKIVVRPVRYLSRSNWEFLTRREYKRIARELQIARLTR